MNLRDEESYQKQKEKPVSRIGSMKIVEVSLTGKLYVLRDASFRRLCIIVKNLGESAQEMLSHGNVWAAPVLLLST